MSAVSTCQPGRPMQAKRRPNPAPLLHCGRNGRARLRISTSALPDSQFGRQHRPVSDDLWVSEHGSPCSAETIRCIIKKHSKGADGLPLTPHLLRSVGATTVAIEAPDSVDIIPAILTHRSSKTAEGHYNLAGNLQAARGYAATRRAHKKELEQAVAREDTHPTMSNPPQVPRSR